MNCSQARDRIRAHLAGGGDSAYAGVDPAAAEHLRQCELCRHWQFDELLRHELGHDEVPEPRAGFVDDLIQTATIQGERRRSPRFSIAAALAAAAVALALLVGNVLDGDGFGDDSYHVAVAPHIAEFVEVVIDAGAGRNEATLTIELADNLELDGFPNERVISWQTQLTEGKNLLRLPLILKDESDSEFNVDLSYGSTRKAITVMVRANDPDTTHSRVRA